MPTQFHLTTQSLGNDRSPVPAVIWTLGALLLCAWGVWFVCGNVTVYETSRKGRLEVVQLPHHIAAPRSGRIASAVVSIGQDVRADQILIELDASADALRLAEETTRLVGMPPRLAAMRAELAALEQARTDDQSGMLAAIDSAGARVRESEAAVRFARNNESRMRKQSVVGGVAGIDALRALSEADKLSAAKDAITADLQRLQQDRQTRAHEAQAKIENLKQTIVALDGDMATTQASIARIRQTIDQHVIRAPIAGRVGDVAALYTGAYVAEGQRLVSVIPPGELMIAGDFAPGSAIGRVRPGQHATMRLEGFPWAQYGSINATVSRVATEVRDGSIRVECTPASTGNPVGIMQHAVSGVIEVAIERTAPAYLVLRAAGLMLSGTVGHATAEPAQ